MKKNWLNTFFFFASHHFVGTIFLFYLGDIKQECIDENAIVETPDERRKRLNRERQAKSKARKKAENPEKVREAERMKKRLQRQRLLAEDPEKLEKMRERDRMRAKRRREKMLKQRDATKAGEASAIVEGWDLTY